MERNKTMFCVECGKEDTIYKNGVCLRCYLKHAQFSKGPAVLDVYECPRCSSYKYKNTWVQESFDAILKRHVKEAFHVAPELKNIEIKTKCTEQERILACQVHISGSLEDETIIEQHPLTVRIKRTTSEVCSREAGGYYEAILQVRADQRLPTKTERGIIRSSVETLVEQLQASGKRSLFITDIDEKREGLDFFFSEKGTALTIAKKIQEQYGGEFKQSASNMGMKDSRQLYRMTYLVRIPSYRTGDIFSYGKAFYYITSVHANKVRTTELSTWEEKVFDGKTLQKIKMLGGKELIKEMIVISQSKTEIQLMDPSTYSTVEIQKPAGVTIQEQMVSTVRHEKRIFLFPKKMS